MSNKGRKACSCTHKDRGEGDERHTAKVGGGEDAPFQNSSLSLNGIDAMRQLSPPPPPLLCHAVRCFLVLAVQGHSFTHPPSPPTQTGASWTRAVTLEDSVPGLGARGVGLRLSTPLARRLAPAVLHHAASACVFVGSGGSSTASSSSTLLRLAWAAAPWG